MNNQNPINLLAPSQIDQLRVLLVAPESYPVARAFCRNWLNDQLQGTGYLVEDVHILQVLDQLATEMASTRLLSRKELYRAIVLVTKLDCAELGYGEFDVLLDELKEIVGGCPDRAKQVDDAMGLAEHSTYDQVASW